MTDTKHRQPSSEDLAAEEQNVIPGQSEQLSNGQLSDKELDQIAGGGRPMNTDPGDGFLS